MGFCKPDGSCVLGARPYRGGVDNLFRGEMGNLRIRKEVMISLALGFAFAVLGPVAQPLNRTPQEFAGAP
jgi:hypothetical protein